MIVHNFFTKISPFCTGIALFGTKICHQSDRFHLMPKCKSTIKEYDNTHHIKLKKFVKITKF